MSVCVRKQDREQIRRALTAPVLVSVYVSVSGIAEQALRHHKPLQHNHKGNHLLGFWFSPKWEQSGEASRPNQVTFSRASWYLLLQKLCS